MIVYPIYPPPTPTKPNPLRLVGVKFILAYVIDNRYLSIDECTFYDLVLSDIKHFVEHCNLKKSVLVFPPVLSHYRFLTHKIVEEEFAELASFSIGEGNNRQTVVCSIYFRGMQSDSKSVSSGKNEVSSRSEPSDRLARPSRGRGRGRGKKILTHSGEGNDVRVGHRQQYEQPVALSHQRDANGKQRKRDLDKTSSSRKSRKPDQALYVPRSLRNQGNKATTVSKTTETATELANEIERPSKRSQKDQHELPHKRHIVDNETQTITADHMASVMVQSGDDKHAEILGVAVLDKEHKDLTDSINDATSDDALVRLDHSDHDDHEPKENDHQIHKNDLTTQEFSSVSGEVQTTEGPQTNIPFAIEFEPQEICSIDLAEKVTKSTEESHLNTQVSPSISVNDDVTKNTDTLENEKSSTSDDHHGKTIAAFKGNVDDVDNLSKSVDQIIEPFYQQNDLDEDHSAIDVETQLHIEENTDDIFEKGDGEPDDGNELIEESMDIEKEDNINEVDLDINIANMEPSTDKSSTAMATTDSVTTGAGDDEEEDGWEAMFDDSGEALTSDAMDEISDAIGKVKVSVKKSKQDYYNYQPKDNFDYGRFNHVIEIFDFPVEFRTEDLIQSFSAYSIKGFDIKWVDDTHALGVFQSVSSAQNALGLQNPMLRTRPLTQATRESKLKARTFVDFLQPARPRPETSAVTARRLVSGALGIKSRESKEQRAAEMKKLKDAKEKRKVDKRLTEDVWEGNTWRL
ncbi:coiled-coil domain-containing protein R3HCC1L-like [Anneissia japonica]|uniref:coiled-coil domain-containing protein R3HCC1L-like n=1 Tax=Anneissia japonica TaxID=1529436 RepID=UPI0014259CD7|nr:coiled-coil domain-containing protein R3HCC1L-like [Anneissia japonica]